MEAIELVITDIESSVSNITSMQTDLEKSAGDNCSIFGSIAGFADTLKDKAVTGIKDILKDLQQTSAALISKMKDAVSKLKDTMASIKKLYTSLKTSIMGLADELKAKVLGLFTSFRDKFAGIKDAFTGLVDGVKSKFKDLKSMFASNLKKFNHSKCSLLKGIIPPIDPKAMISDISASAMPALNTVKSSLLDSVPKFDISIPTNLQDMLA